MVAPQEPLLTDKGIAMVLADGISSSSVSQIASATAVKGFLEDYFSTPESWSVKTSAYRVLQAANSWLYAQTRNSPYRYEMDRGYVCTFSALVIKSATAHLFHIGDTRVYRLIDNGLEQLTEDHLVQASGRKQYLGRALGMRDYLDIDYRTFPVEIGDIFISSTDGVHDYASEKFITETITLHQNDFDQAARLILDEALKQGSDDNLTIQILRIEQLPNHNIDELQEQASILPFPPDLRPCMQFDGFEVLRELHHSSRSHLYLVLDPASNRQLALKLPSVALRDDPIYIEHFLMEEWVARRLDSAHLLKHYEMTRKRNYLYTIAEFIDGQTLSQWMNDNPKPPLETVRNIVEQIARGLYAMHRQEMLHQDLRPDNIMLDKTGTVKIVDFGAVRVAGVAELTPANDRQHMFGTEQYAAPEYFLGESGSTRSDLYSLGVITYQLLSGRLPYGAQVARARNQSAQLRLKYQSVLDANRTLPVWIDDAIHKAVYPEPYKRYSEISEFIHDLRHPNPKFIDRDRPPLLQRNPVRFWQGISLLLLLIIILILNMHSVFKP